MTVIEVETISAADAAESWPRSVADLDATATGLPAEEPIAAEHYLRVLADGEAAGLIWFRPFLPEYRVWWYGAALRPEYRGRGIASAMSRAAASWAFAQSPPIAAILASSRTTNPRAVKRLLGDPLYRRMGTIRDAAGPGVDVVLAQITRESLAAAGVTIQGDDG